MEESRYKKIFDILVETEGYCSAGTIGEQLGVSVKTVRNALREMNGLFERHGARIASKSNAGCRLIISDKSAFEQFLASDWSRYAFVRDDYNNPAYRQRSILKKLLFSENGFSMDQLSYDFNISEYTLLSDLKALREPLSGYHLILHITDGRGVYISGTEGNLRTCISGLLQGVPRDELLRALPGEGNLPSCYSLIEETALSVLKAFRYDLNHAAMDSLMLHLCIMVGRATIQVPIPADASLTGRYAGKEELTIARQLLKQLSDRLELTFANTEAEYLTGKLITLRRDLCRPNPVISMQTDELIHEMLLTVYQDTGIDFRTDFDLRIPLSIHVEQLLERLHYGLSVKNPFLGELRSDILAYEMAVSASKPIRRRYGIVSEDEIGYIALYFASALEQKNRRVSKKSIAIVCGSGRATAHLMKERFLREFEQCCGKLDIFDLATAGKTDFDSYDLIVSSVPLETGGATPIIQVSPLLNKADVRHLAAAVRKDSARKWTGIFDPQLFFTDFSCRGREDFLEKIAKEICHVRKLDGDLLEEMKARENIVPTEYDNLVALPHPLHPLSDETFVTVAILAHPMRWKTRDVQLILVMNIGRKPPEGIEDFYAVISRALSGRRSVRELMETKNLNAFLETLIREGNDNGQ
ncbi:MAG: transcription antiterminator [Erysipelotrichaceae bacterium]|nr:transcription antiterminator [Erysipelotrichaceae bacterium]